MKKYVFLIIVLFVQIALYAQEYFPESTKWTEIRLDTLKYDSWYSKVGDEWVPNFETVEYYVKGEYEGGYRDYKLVYTNGPEWSDSLTLLISESQYGLEVTVAVFHENEEFFPPGWAYGFGVWKVGITLSYQTINGVNIPSLPPVGIKEYGTITEIKEANFGGVRSLKYVDLDGTRLIHGIGVTTWNDGECIFGPVDPYFCYSGMYSDLPQERHYRSMLVHFERNGEVLYNIWPEKVSGINSTHNAETKHDNIIYDLQGRQLLRAPQKGIYIRNGKKVAVK